MSVLAFYTEVWKKKYISHISSSTLTVSEEDVCCLVCKGCIFEIINETMNRL